MSTGIDGSHAQISSIACVSLSLFSLVLCLIIRGEAFFDFGRVIGIVAKTVGGVAGLIGSIFNVADISFEKG